MLKLNNKLVSVDSFLGPAIGMPFSNFPANKTQSFNDNGQRKARRQESRKAGRKRLRTRKLPFIEVLGSPFLYLLLHFFVSLLKSK